MVTSLLNRLAYTSLIAGVLTLSSSGCALMSRGNVNSRPLEPGELAEYQQQLAEEADLPSPNQPTVKVSTAALEAA